MIRIILHNLSKKFPIAKESVRSFAPDSSGEIVHELKQLKENTAGTWKSVELLLQESRSSMNLTFNSIAAASGLAALGALWMNHNYQHQNTVTARVHHEEYAYWLRKGVEASIAVNHELFELRKTQTVMLYTILGYAYKRGVGTGAGMADLSKIVKDSLKAITTEQSKLQSTLADSHSLSNGANATDSSGSDAARDSSSDRGSKKSSPNQTESGNGLGAPAENDSGSGEGFKTSSPSQPGDGSALVAHATKASGNDAGDDCSLSQPVGGSGSGGESH